MLLWLCGGMLYQIRNKLNAECLRMLYHSLVYSYMVYGICLWGGSLAKYVRSVIVAQKRAVKTISYVGRYESSHHLFVENKFLKFQNMYKYFLCVLMHKFVHLQYCSRTFTLSQRLYHYNIRNTINTVSIPRWRKELCRRSACYQGPSHWNALDQDFRIINNINTFKKKCKFILLSQQIL